MWLIRGVPHIGEGYGDVVNQLTHTAPATTVRNVFTGENKCYGRMEYRGCAEFLL